MNGGALSENDGFPSASSWQTLFPARVNIIPSVNSISCLLTLASSNILATRGKIKQEVELNLTGKSIDNEKKIRHS